MSDFNKDETKSVTEEIKMEDSATEIPAVPKQEKKQKKAGKITSDDFISRKLAIINQMNNPAKKIRLAERVLNNRKAGK